MRKLFNYYIKKRFLAIVCLTTLFTAFVSILCLTSNFVRVSYTGDLYPITPPTVAISVVMSLFIVIVAILEFSFKMNKKNIDCYYSLPIKREKFYFVKYIIGLIEIFIPFIVGFAALLIIVPLKENCYNYPYFFAYFGEISGAFILFYTIICYIYTRGNTVLDGVILLTLYTFVFEVIYLGISKMVPYLDSFQNFYFLFTQIDLITTLVNNRIIGNTPTAEYIANNQVHYTLVHLLMIVLGLVSFIMLILQNYTDKAENTTNKTESWLGYKTILPIYIVFGMVAVENDIAASIMIAIVGVLGYFVYNRGFKLSLSKIIPLASSILIGFIIALIIR